MRRADRVAERSPAFAAAGWLLAELALILMVVLMGSVPGTHAEPSTQPTGESTSKPPPQVGLRLKPVRIDDVVLSGPNDRNAADRLVREIGASKTHRPGLLLIFGVSYNGRPPNSGTAVAEDLRTLLSEIGFTRDWPVVVRPFLQIFGAGYSHGQVLVDVYYYSDAGH